MPGTLYLIPSALGDTPWSRYLAPESRDIACRLEYFIVENARSARAELKRLGHPGPLQALAIVQLPGRVQLEQIDTLLQPLLEGRDVGMLCEAGCPAVADPGAFVARRAHAHGITVQPLVGASSLLLALMASGLDGQRFAFHGYLPQHDPERAKRIRQIEQDSRGQRQTQMFIETPYRNRALFDALLAALHADTWLCVACDLTLPEALVATRRIVEWKKLPPPHIERRPTVFLLLSGD